MGCPRWSARLVAAVSALVACAACDERDPEAPAPVAPTPEAPPAPDGPYVRVLGTAQDGGFPHAACTCVRCDAARDDPARQRLVASIAVVLPEAGQVYLVDATPDLRPQLDALAAFVIRGPRSSLLYAPDTDRWEGWDPTPETVLAGVDVALVDGTFFSGDELPGRDVSEIGHPLVTGSMTRFTPLVREAGVRVVFTHLNHSNPLLEPAGDALERVRAAGFEVARDGMVFPL